MLRKRAYSFCPERGCLVGGLRTPGTRPPRHAAPDNCFSRPAAFGHGIARQRLLYCRHHGGECRTPVFAHPPRRLPISEKQHFMRQTQQKTRSGQFCRYAAGADRSAREQFSPCLPENVSSR
jgi:hypothetical protein